MCITLIKQIVGPDADWYAFCQAIYKGIEGNEQEELYCHFREMSKAAGARKPSETRKAKALWAMKAARDRRDEFNELARKRQHLGKESDETGVVGRTSQRPDHSVGQNL